MDEFKLLRFGEGDSLKEYKFLSTLESESGFNNDCYQMSYEEFVTDYEQHVRETELGINLKEGWVPGTIFLLYKNKDIVAVYNVRHFLNDNLRNGAGHIGYAVGKKYRGNGYGAIGLKLAINELIKMPDFLDNEIYMSCNKDNIASYKTQLKVGAYLDHEDKDHYYTRVKVASFKQ